MRYEVFEYKRYYICRDEPYPDRDQIGYTQMKKKEKQHRAESG